MYMYILYIHQESMCTCVPPSHECTVASTGSTFTRGQEPLYLSGRVPCGLAREVGVDVAEVGQVDCQVRDARETGGVHVITQLFPGDSEGGVKA